MRNPLLLTLICCIFGMAGLKAQDTTRGGRPLPAPRGDTARRELKRSERPGAVFHKIEHRKFDSTLFTTTEVTSSDYLENLEKIYQLLSSVPETTASFIHLPEIQEQFDREDSALAILKDRITTSDDRTLNIRNLQMFNTLLDELEKNTGQYAKYLNDYDKKVDEVKARIGNMRKDTLILHIFRDTTLKTTFQPQLTELKDKWRQADSVVKLNEAEINDLKARASTNSIIIADLSYRVDAELKHAAGRIFGKERRYLWEPRPPGQPGFSREAVQQSLGSEKKLVKYYFANSRGNRFWLLLTGIVFFFWIWYNFRALGRLNRLSAIAAFRFRYINAMPFSTSLLFVLTLAPLFDLHAPAIYIESIQFLLMVLLTFIFWKRLPHNQFYGWCVFILLFLLLPLTGILGMPVAMQRWANIIQNGLSFAFGIFFLFGSKLKDAGQPGSKLETGVVTDVKRPENVKVEEVMPGGNARPGIAGGALSPDTKARAAGTAAERIPPPGRSKILLYAAILYSLFNLLAVVCNMSGRVTLSQILGATAIYAFAQTISLAVFIQLVVESFLLQVQTSRVRKDYPEQFDSAGVSKSVYRFATALAIILFLIVFTTNLNLFDGISDLLTNVLTTPREVGSISFTLGGICLFMGIIWIANFLQRYITYFFGDTGDDAAIDDKGQRSKLLVTRLILLTLGFFLAVAASGLPIDKITVVLGALGVGIGLGLQSIVNNFVSGIILIFDRPLRIGDTVEIGDKKGRVKEIGIRSSTLLTDEGAEVIIPNGDVLSHNIVNWTLSNNHVRVSLSFTIDKPPHPEDIGSDEIRELIKTNPNVLERREPEIVLNNISSKSIEIKVYFWSKDFNKTTLTAGDVRTRIYEYFEKKGITVE